MRDIKFIHFTDPHLLAGSPQLYGLDPAGRLQACVSHIGEHHADAALAMLTGDLTHDGSVASYRQLRQLLAPLSMPVHPLLGNHDDRRSFREVFDGVSTDPAGFVQYAIEHGGRRFIALDTLATGSHQGMLDAPRLNWLQQTLQVRPDLPTYIFMHHPPIRVGMPSSDPMSVDAPTLPAILAAAGNVRHIFFGHLHRPVSGLWNNIPFSGIPGLSHQVALDLHENGGRVRGSHEAPCYSVVLLRNDDVIIHHCHFLDRSDTFDL